MRPLQFFLTTIFIAALTASTPAVAQSIDPSSAQTGALLMKGANGYQSAALLNTDVNIRINGLVARVSVMQEFENTADEWLEGVYVFPLPEDAAVDQMRLYIGDRFIEGEIREKEQARREYEQAKAEGKKTGLVEQQRANLFTTSVANIAPGEIVIVEIEYLEDLRYDAGNFSLRFPMTLTPRFTPVIADPRVKPGAAAIVQQSDQIPLATDSPAHKVSLRAAVNAGMPLEIVASRYHGVNVSESGGQYLVSLAGGRVPMDHDFELVWRPVPSALARAMVFSETVNDQPHFLVMVVPPEPTMLSGPTMPREMIFIIDTSGSMHGESIAQAKDALLNAIDALQPTDRFNVIEFNSASYPLFAESRSADAANLSTARAFVMRMRADGGTNMAPALQFALSGTPLSEYLRQVVFITDGAVGNEDQLFQMIESQLDRARLFTVGIGSAPNSWFMRKAAEAGRGSFTTISDLNEVGEKMGRLFKKLEAPQVTDIDVVWPSGVTIDSYPETVPDLYLGEPVTIKARASGAVRPGDRLRVSGNSVMGGWSADIPLADGTESPGVGALWARARIGHLMDTLRRGADATAVRASVVETAIAHHLVSRFTSLVAVDKTPERSAAEALRAEQVANLAPRGHTASFPATATASQRHLMAGILLLLSAWFFHRARKPRYASA
ncbi:MAG: marine proteobacterial sortase target protein [Pseudomonadota bacterium]